MSIQMVSPRFVGRARELGALGRALSRAKAGGASTVLVGGEAGVGKTRLIKEFANRAAARVLIGGCLELGTDGLPFAPFTAVLRRLVREIGHDGVAALVPGGNTRGLARLLPDFGEPEGEGAEARARLFEQVLGLLERLAETEPVMVVIEDAHWADRSTRDLLSFLVRYQRSDVPLLLVVSYRADELHRTHPLRPLLAELSRVEWVSKIDLGRLSRREVVAQAASILEREPSPVAIDEIYARSEGNPLFVEALISEAGGGDTLPESLRDLLLAGVERLPEETQELLRVASAGGQHIEHDLLIAVAGLDEGALSRALRPAVAGNVLVVDGEGYSFRHALIREALHDDLLPGEHTRLHTRFAQALEADATILPSPRGEIELAHHWHAAHDTLWGLVAAWRASDAARKSAAYDEQLRMLSRVLELWERVPDAEERIGADRIEVLRLAASAASLAGEFDRTISLATAALEQLDSATDPIRAAGLLRLRGLVRFQFGRPGHVEDLRAAVALTPQDPPTKLRGQILETLARMLNTPETYADKTANAEEAVRIARAVGDGSTESHALTTLAWCRYDFADTAGMAGAFAEARAVAQAHQAYDALLRVAISESDQLQGAGLHEEAAAMARRGIADSEAYGLARTSGTFLAINLAEPLVSLGRWDEAIEVIEQALDLTPPAPYRASLQGFVGDIALARGDLERAQTLFNAQRSVLARGSFRDQTVLPHALREIELLAAQGRAEEGRELAARTLREQDLVASPRYSWPLLLVTALLFPDLLPEVSSQARSLRVEGELQRAESLTFAALAGPAEDLTAWQAAVDAWEGLRQPYTRARVLVGVARAAHLNGERKAAAERLATARELAGQLGAKPLITEIDDFARRAGVGQEGGRQAAGPGLGLTARELEVLRLLTDGRSNREIAAELFISAKTVSVHVSNILAKLEVSSRGEAAATAHRYGLFEVSR
ncbi:helix-turn-helix transcriptional regulator [Nonomuraea sp. NBC_01738]|uniref:helix-turn-helix transcriptional regulator n=1 Tax=Nonomuraea sp. NBC_01738 TaxID=2976003 RepID=UPI002E10093F